jgi:hypothetical protein
MTYFKLMDCNGSLHSGAPSLSAIEARRASLIAENERRADLVRCGFHSTMMFPMPPRQKQATIRAYRTHLAMIKADLKHWQSAKVEEIRI